jgi:hypothetical protein
MYLGFKRVKEENRDSIWKFIVQNNYKPYFLQHEFDYVIGNPPWFTYSAIRNEDYQDTLNKLALTYNVKPKKQANYPHLEIAAIFLAFCSDYFLNDKGKIAFVVPRSFFSADQHENTRSGSADGFSLTDVWDLYDVKPVFRIPSGVLFARRADKKSKTVNTSWQGKVFSGHLTAHNCNWAEAKPKLTEENKQWYYTQRGDMSAFSTTSKVIRTDASPYKNQFKQGATIVPRSFYFVELAQATPRNLKDVDEILLRTSEEVLIESKKPWKTTTIQGRIESEFLFRTALSKSILPFALHKPNLIVLPITIEKTKAGNKEVKLHSASELKNSDS